VVEKHHPNGQDNLRESASKVTKSDVLGSGRVLPKLFQYLVEMAIKGEVPKEFDIALDVFGKDARYRDAGDAQIRVWIYRLRSRLDRYYANAGRSDPFRLQIPKGTYKVTAARNDGAGDLLPHATNRVQVFAAGAFAVVAVLAIAAWALVHDSGRAAERSLPSSSIWSSIAQSDLPILIVVGDHFFFGEPGTPIRVRDIRINSEDELRRAEVFRANPGLTFDTLSYLPKSVVFGLPQILPHANASSPNVAMKLVSELAPDDLRAANIVYLGFIRSMGVLRDYYQTKSNFVFEPPYLEIVHAGTEQVYSRTDDSSARIRDYGLFARFEGPSGNQILVFSGIADIGVAATARALSTEDSIGRIEEMIESHALDPSGDLEILLEVDGQSRTETDVRVLGLFPIDEHSGPFNGRPSLSKLP
jgi:hypothetical protein